MLDKNTEVSVLNYSRSPVAVTTRDMHYLVPGGYEDRPAEFPMSMSELSYINSTTDVFRIGLLFFDPEVEAEVYAGLHIKDWEKIYRTEQIDQLLLHPTVAGLEDMLSITNIAYFDRFYGEYIGLRNAGYPISGSVEQVMQLRRKELTSGQPVTSIRVKDTMLDQPVQDTETVKKMEDMQREIAELKELLKQTMAQPAAPKAKKPASSKAKPKTAQGEDKQKEE